MLEARTLGAALVLSLLVAAPQAQAPASFTDPATGETAQGTTSGGFLFVPGSGGEVIGYTTNNAFLHYRTLDQLTQAFDDLVADGHTLVPIDALIAVNLVGLDRLVVGVADPSYVLTQGEIFNITNFVRHGGTLVFLGENNNFFHANNEALGNEFRFDYPDVDPPQTVLTLVNPHPITAGPHGAVNTVDGSANSTGFFGSMEAPGPRAYSLVDFDSGESMGLVLEPGDYYPGSGLVVAFSEVNIWTDNEYNDGDNRALFRNTFSYDPPVPLVSGLSKPGLAALVASTKAATQ